MALTFALLSPCGFGNLGDAAIQDAMIASIRLRSPDARILGITLNPRDTEQRHGIATFPISVEAQQHCAGTNSICDGGDAKQVAFQNRPHVISGLFGLLRAILRSVLPKPLRAGLRTMWGGFGTMWQEARHLAAAFRWLQSVDVLVFSGGGQLDDFWGGPFGHPLALFKWALLAKMRRARVLFMSVGYGTLESRWSRLLTRWALSLADYCSYRDAGSRALMMRAGVGRVDPVVPDLAYSRSAGTRPTPFLGAVRRVGISPISYCDPRSWPIRDARIFEDYLKRLTEAAAWLIDTGRELVFFASAGADQRVVTEMVDQVSTRIAPEQRSLIRHAAVLTVDDFLEQAAAVDVVVASRLHGLLLSHLVGTPTIAVSYERKVDVLMDAMEQGVYNLNIEAFSLTAFQRAFAALEGGWRTAHDGLLAKRAEYRGLLEYQYDQVLCNGSYTTRPVKQETRHAG
jgi:polysaccharide pyruvyl transferase WcaK-like protein